MNRLLELASRVEAAEWSDRMLDAAIWYAVVEKPEGGRRDADMAGRWPAYTESLDAALTLVNSPYWMIRNEDRGFVATIMDSRAREHEAEAHTAALALTAAALRARSVQP